MKIYGGGAFLCYASSDEIIHPSPYPFPVPWVFPWNLSSVREWTEVLLLSEGERLYAVIRPPGSAQNKDDDWITRDVWTTVGFTFLEDDDKPEPPSVVDLNNEPLVKPGNYISCPNGKVFLDCSGEYDTDSNTTNWYDGEWCSGITAYRVYEAAQEGEVLIREFPATPANKGQLFPDGFPIENLSEGPHILSIKVVDAAGNESVKSGPISFTIDNTGPPVPQDFIVVNTRSVNGYDYLTQEENGYAVLQWEQESEPQAGSGLDRYELAVRNTEEDESTVLEIGYEPYGNEIKGSDVDFSSFGNGTYELSLTPIDKVGNRGDKAIIECIGIDRIPPAAPHSITIEGSFEITDRGWYYKPDVSALSSAILRWQGDAADEGSGFNQFIIERQTMDGNWEEIAFHDGKGELYSTVKMGNDVETYRVVAQDKAGNESAGQAFTVHLLADPVEAGFTFSDVDSGGTIDSPYYDDGSGYHLRWNAAETGLEEEVTIDYYKIILIPEEEVPEVFGDSDGKPIYDDFAVTGSDYYLSPGIYSGSDPRTLRLTNWPDESLNIIETGRYYVAYILAVSSLHDRPECNNIDHYSVAMKLLYLPPLEVTADDGEEYCLEENEVWWQGEHNLHTTVVIPDGVRLTVMPGTEVIIHGNGEIGISVKPGGELVVKGDGKGDIKFRSEANEGPEDWQGILVEGNAEISGCVIENAERAITAADEGTVPDIRIEESVITGNRVGVHAYKAGLTIVSCDFVNNELYDIKEDGITGDENRPVIQSCLFQGAAYEYYHTQRLNISMDDLNAIGGNAGNEEVK